MIAILTAHWIWIRDVTPNGAEFVVRGYYSDELPPRVRRRIGKVMKNKGRFVPYAYCNIKSKCHAGPVSHPRSCTKPGHSCTRKVVSYYRMPFRRENRMVHRAAQVILERLPSHELWALKNGPRTLREKCDPLKYLKCYERKYIFCEGPKRKVTSLVTDASQASRG